MARESIAQPGGPKPSSFLLLAAGWKPRITTRRPWQVSKAGSCSEQASRSSASSRFYLAAKTDSGDPFCQAGDQQTSSPALPGDIRTIICRPPGNQADRKVDQVTDGRKYGQVAATAPPPPQADPAIARPASSANRQRQIHRSMPCAQQRREGRQRRRHHAKLSSTALANRRLGSAQGDNKHHSRASPQPTGLPAFRPRICPGRAISRRRINNCAGGRAVEAGSRKLSNRRANPSHDSTSLQPRSPPGRRGSGGSSLAHFFLHRDRTGGDRPRPGSNSAALRAWRSDRPPPSQRELPVPE